MILTAVLVGISSFVGLLCAGGVIFYVAKRQIVKVCRTFIESPSPDVASPLAFAVTEASRIAGAQVAQSLKAVFMGLESVEAKNTRKLEAATIASSSPMVSALVNAFPGLGKRILKNPALAGLAIDVAQKVLAGKGGGAPDNGHAISFKF
jgi:galactokinase/mevalonate kinase-like predicted kinase